MGKFKVGDKVRIRKDLKVGDWYYGVDFSTNMEKFRGREYKINYRTRGTYTLDGCDGYWFNDTMLEPIQEESKEAESKEEYTFQKVILEPMQEPIKEEYTFQEVIQRIKNGETYVSTDINYRLNSIKCISGDIQFAGEFSSVFRTDEYQKFKLQETKKKYTLYFIEYNPDGERYKFRSDNANLKLGQFVVCNSTRYGKTFGRVANIVSYILTEEEYLDIKECYEA